MTRDGLKAEPYTYGDLNPYSPHRYFEAGWTVSNGTKVVGSGYGDVRLLGGGLFAAKQWNDFGYRIYDANGNALTKEYASVESLGGTGRFAIADENGMGMTTVHDRNLKSIRTVPTYDLNTYLQSDDFSREAAKQELTSAPDVGMSAKLNPVNDSSQRTGGSQAAGQEPGAKATPGGIKADIHIGSEDFRPIPKRQR